jgi:hypothetical protein
MGSAIWYYLNRYGNNRPKIVIVEPFEADPYHHLKPMREIKPDCTLKQLWQD